MPAIPKKSIKLSPHKLSKLFLEAHERDGHTCQIDGLVYPPEALTGHHIIPRGRLRLDILDNIMTINIWDHIPLHDGVLDVSVDDLIERFRYRLGEYLK